MTSLLLFLSLSSHAQTIQEIRGSVATIDPGNLSIEKGDKLLALNQGKKGSSLFVTSVDGKRVTANVLKGNPKVGDSILKMINFGGKSCRSTEDCHAFKCKTSEMAECWNLECACHSGRVD